jgi:predicted metal-dependent hydrolase
MILIISILFYAISYYVFKDGGDVVYVKSNIIKEKFVVQNTKDKKKAADILGQIYVNIFKLRSHLNKNIESYPEFKQYIEQFCSRIKNVELAENSNKGDHTSFTINKGDKIALCLKSKQTDRFHDINLIMYVTLHELAHVACPELDHTDLFKKIFAFILTVASDINIYKRVDYKVKPKEYCGLIISEGS